MEKPTAAQHDVIQIGRFGTSVRQAGEFFPGDPETGAVPLLMDIATAALWLGRSAHDLRPWLVFVAPAQHTDDGRPLYAGRDIAALGCRLTAVDSALKHLARLGTNQLGAQTVAAITGVKISTLRHLARREGLRLENRQDITRLIRRIRPLLEQWPTPTRLGTLLRLGPHIPRRWYRKPPSRKRCGATKVLGMIRFDPVILGNLFGEITDWAGDLILLEEVAKLLGKTPETIRSWHRVLPFVQPGGRKTLRLYSRRTTAALRSRVREADEILWLTSSRLAQLLSEKTGKTLSAADIRKHIPPTSTDPITGRLLYAPEVATQHLKDAFITAIPLHQVLDSCEKDVAHKASLRREIAYLLTRGHIPSCKAKGKNSATYLTPEGAAKVQNIYAHMKTLQREGIVLIELPKASAKLHLRYRQLHRLLNRCGQEYLLTDSTPISHVLSLEPAEPGTHPRPRIPCVRWAASTRRMLSSVVIETLGEMLERLRRDAKKANLKTLYDSHWPARLAAMIQSTEILRFKAEQLISAGQCESLEDIIQILALYTGTSEAEVRRAFHPPRKAATPPGELLQALDDIAWTTSPEPYSESGSYRRGQILSFPYPGSAPPGIGIVLQGDSTSSTIQVRRNDIRDVVTMAHRIRTCYT